MYWSYLLSNKISKSNEIKILPFESNDNLNKMISCYCDLVKDNFFSSFSNEYDCIFISKYDITHFTQITADKTRQENLKVFEISFNDIQKASCYLLSKNRKKFIL